MVKARLRLAVATLRDTRELEQVLEELAQAGVDDTDICLVAGEGHLAEPPLAPGHRRARLTATVVPIAAGTDAGRVMATSGPLARRFLEATEDETAPLAGMLVHWLPERLARELGDHVDRGGLLLWVQVRDGTEEQRACTVLLKHSQVRVHDI
ncbi:MAG: hypothetical protein ACE5Q3_14925 [Alphaproteobacteria bacterium]